MNENLTFSKPEISFEGIVLNAHIGDHDVQVVFPRTVVQDFFSGQVGDEFRGVFERHQKEMERAAMSLVAQDRSGNLGEIRVMRAQLLGLGFREIGAKA
jgi:hypothetical protein